MNKLKHEQTETHGRMLKSLAITVCLSSASIANGQEVSVCKYWGDRTAAVSLTYDDGVKEHKTLVATELEKRGLRGTFWIIGNRVGAEETPHGARLSWSDIRDMEKQGHEMASHSWSHPNCRKVGFEAFMYDV